MNIFVVKKALEIVCNFSPCIVIIYEVQHTGKTLSVEGLIILSYLVRNVKIMAHV